MSDEDEFQSGQDKPWWAEMMRELTLTGLATYFMTEDSIRGYLKERKFPKELASLFIDGVSKKKEDLYGLLAKEFGRVLAKIDISREMEKFLERHDMQLNVNVSFERKKTAPLPETESV